MRRATSFLRIGVVGLGLLASSGGFGQQSKKVPLCEEFLAHLNSRVQLTPFKLEETEVGEGHLEIRDIDVDGDKRPDKLVLFRTGSASLIPPDNSTVTLTLSSTGQELSLEFQRFYLIRFGEGVYVVGGNVLGEKGPVEIQIHRVGRTGFALVCSYRCGLTTACTQTRAKAARAGNAGRYVF